MHEKTIAAQQIAYQSAAVTVRTPALQTIRESRVALHHQAGFAPCLSAAVTGAEALGAATVRGPPTARDFS